MPSVKGLPGPYRFYFFSFDCVEPKHVHVERDDNACKFWLEPLSLSKNHGFSAKELNKIRRTIAENMGPILEAWNEHCGSYRSPF